MVYKEVTGLLPFLGRGGEEGQAEKLVAI